MTRLLIITAALWLAAAAPALAEVTVFDSLYSIDIPRTWTVTDQDGLLTLTSPDRQAVFLITKGLSAGQHRERIAGELPKYAGITSANPERQVTLTRLKGLRVVVTILGDHPDRVGLYYSIKELERAKESWRVD